MTRTMLRPTALAALLAGLAAPAAAAEWRVLRAESRIGFTVPFVMNGTVLRGSFRDWQAGIRFDPDRPEAARVEVTVRTGSARTGDREADAELPSPEWFAVRAFPEARFVATTIRPAGEGRWEAAGQLTLRDVTRPVVLPFALRIEGGRARMEGALVLDRVAFQVGDGPDPNGNIAGLEVALAVEVVAERAE